MGWMWTICEGDGDEEERASLGQVDVVGVGLLSVRIWDGVRVDV